MSEGSRESPNSGELILARQSKLVALWLFGERENLRSVQMTTAGGDSASVYVHIRPIAAVPQFDHLSPAT